MKQQTSIKNIKNHLFIIRQQEHHMKNNSIHYTPQRVEFILKGNMFTKKNPKTLLTPINEKKPNKLKIKLLDIKNKLKQLRIEQDDLKTITLKNMNQNKQLLLSINQQIQLEKESLLDVFSLEKMQILLLQLKQVPLKGQQQIETKI